MTRYRKSDFSPEHFDAARRFIAADTATSVPYSSTSEATPKGLNEFADSLLDLVRAADAVAQRNPDQQEFEALRWVPAAKFLLRFLRRETGTAGPAESNIFNDVNIVHQAELHELATASDSSVSVGLSTEI